MASNTPVLLFISFFSCNYSGFLIPGYYSWKRNIPFFFLLIHAVAMKIAAALGVWPFWGWKIINHGGWFTQVKGRSWQKKRSSLYRSCLHERVILPDYRITSLLQFIHHFYITFTSFLQLIRHFYVTFTSVPSSVPFVHHPLPERADSGFSGCAGKVSQLRNKLPARSPFQVRWKILFFGVGFEFRLKPDAWQSAA